MGALSYPMLLLTGVVPFQFFMSSISTAGAAIPSSMGLFFYKQIKPIDTILAKVFLEFVVFVLSYCVLAIVYIPLGWLQWPAHILELLAVYVVYVIFTFSCSLLIAVLTFFYDRKITVPLSFLRRTLFFCSGIFYPISRLPAFIRDYLTWNPIVHILELSREAYVKDYHNQYGSWRFLLISTLVLFVVSMLYYRSNRLGLLNPAS